MIFYSRIIRDYLITVIVAYSFLTLLVLTLLGEGPSHALMGNIVKLLHNGLYFTLGYIQ